MPRLILTLLLLLTAFHPAPASAADPFATIAPLEPGLHLGYGTFSPVPESDFPTLNDRIAEATSAGMDVARVLVDWAEVETNPGEYDFSTLDSQLEQVPSGTRLLLTLGVTDVDRYAIPADLQISDTELAAPLDEPGVIGRYLDLLDAVLPRLAEDYGLFALSVANEPDALLADRPAEEATALATFTMAVSEYAAEWLPGLSVTLSISGGGVTYPPDFIPELIAATDIATFNWGCIDLATFNVTDPASIPDEVALLLATADGRDVIIQELSCPSGYSDRASFVGASPDSQATWFDAFFSAMASEPRFRAVFVLDLVDWPAKLAAQYTAFIRAEGLGDIADRYEELLATRGLLEYDLTPKPAWQVFLDHLRLL